MHCPDELTLELWLAGVLPSEEHTFVAGHAQTCATCQDRAAAGCGETAMLAEALALDDNEGAFLAQVDLAGRWRAARQPAPWWGWLVLVATLATAVVWSLAWPSAGRLLELATRSGLSGVLLQALLAALWTAGHGVLALAANPLVRGSLPLLGLLGLALLLAPRLLAAGAPGRSPG